MGNKFDFFGALERVTVIDKDDSGHLASSEAVCGNEVELVYETDDEGRPRVRVKSKRGYSFGCFSRDFSFKLQQLHDNGHIVVAYISAVAYSEDEGHFWGEFTVIGYPAEEAAMWDVFRKLLAKRIADGKHPDVHLSPKVHRLIRENDGNWCDLKSAPYPKLEKGGLYYKKRRTFKDSLIMKASTNNKGCVFGAIIFWAAVIAGVGYWVYKAFFA